ncbi:MAG: hypothetical protein K1X28_05515 [Parachlamydiales bacterium]|nr:hypothetical protein [Parachlamydiales bacterium]
MNNQFIELLKEVFENPDSIDMNQLGKMVSETNKYLASLKASLESDDPKEKEQALALALEVRDFLESKSNEFMPKIGFEPSEEEQAIVAEIQKSLNINSREKGKKHLLKPNIKVS